METQSRNWKHATFQGFRQRCPRCGKGHIFTSYLGIAAKCPHCGEDFQHQRADDAPPYFTIMVVGHIIVPLLLLVEKLYAPELWVHFIIWLPLTALMTLWLLPRIKGATVGLQWAFHMHGFGDNR